MLVLVLLSFAALTSALSASPACLACSPTQIANCSVYGGCVTSQGSICQTCVSALLAGQTLPANCITDAATCSLLTCTFRACGATCASALQATTCPAGSTILAKPKLLRDGLTVCNNTVSVINFVVNAENDATPVSPLSNPLVNLVVTETVPAAFVINTAVVPTIGSLFGWPGPNAGDSCSWSGRTWTCTFATPVVQTQQVQISFQGTLAAGAPANIVHTIIATGSGQSFQLNPVTSVVACTSTVPPATTTSTTTVTTTTTKATTTTTAAPTVPPTTAPSTPCYSCAINNQQCLQLPCTTTDCATCLGALAAIPPAQLSNTSLPSVCTTDAQACQIVSCFIGGCTGVCGSISCAGCKPAGSSCTQSTDCCGYALGNVEPNPLTCDGHNRSPQVVRCYNNVCTYCQFFQGGTCSGANSACCDDTMTCARHTSLCDENSFCDEDTKYVAGVARTTRLCVPKRSTQDNSRLQ